MSIRSTTLAPFFQKLKKKQAVDCYDCIFKLKQEIAVVPFTDFPMDERQIHKKSEWIGIFSVRLIMLNPQTSNDLV